VAIVANATLCRAISHGSAGQFQNFMHAFSNFQNPSWAISIRFAISDNRKRLEIKKGKN
jgi:hypothetical protein